MSVVLQSQQALNRKTMKIERFEELECWKESRALVKLVYQAIHESSNIKN